MESSKRQVDPAPDSRGLPDSVAARRIAFRPTHATYFPGPVLSAMQRSIAPRALSPPAVARDRPLRTAALRDALHSEPVRFPVLWLCAGMAISVRGYHRLIPFVFVPGNVAGVVIPYQDHPFGSGFMMA